MNKETIEKVLQIAINNGYEEIVQKGSMNTMDCLNDDIYTEFILEQKTYIINFTSKDCIDAICKYIFNSYPKNEFNLFQGYLSSKETLLRRYKETLIDAIYNSTLEEFFTGLIK